MDQFNLEGWYHHPYQSGTPVEQQAQPPDSVLQPETSYRAQAPDNQHSQLPQSGWDPYRNQYNNLDTDLCTLEYSTTGWQQPDHGLSPHPPPHTLRNQSLDPVQFDNNPGPAIADWNTSCYAPAQSEYSTLAAFLPPDNRTTRPGSASHASSSTLTRPSTAQKAIPLRPSPAAAAYSHVNPPNLHRANSTSAASGFHYQPHPPAPLHSRSYSFSPASATQQLQIPHPTTHYNTEPVMRQAQVYQNRSLPRDWTASYSNEVSPRSQPTMLPAVQQPYTHTSWLTPSGLADSVDLTSRVDGHAVLGLSLGDENSGLAGVGSPLSDQGMRNWTAALLPVAEPLDGAVSGRFNDETTAFSIPDSLAGPSSTRPPSPVSYTPGLDRVDPPAVTGSWSPKSQPSSISSATRQNVNANGYGTAFSAYEPQSAGAAGARPRQPRRRPNEPPRNPALRRYPCRECIVTPRTFARPSALKIHMLTHTKEKRESAFSRAQVVRPELIFPSLRSPHLRSLSTRVRDPIQSEASPEAAQQGQRLSRVRRRAGRAGRGRGRFARWRHGAARRSDLGGAQRVAIRRQMTVCLFLLTSLIG